MAVHLNLRGRRHRRGARNAPWLETSPCCTWYPDGLVSLCRTTREVLVTWIAAAAAAMRSAVAKQVPISRGKGAGACTHSKVHVMLTRVGSSSTHPDIATCHSVLAKSRLWVRTIFPSFSRVVGPFGMWDSTIFQFCLTMIILVLTPTP